MQVVVFDIAPSPPSAPKDTDTLSFLTPHAHTAPEPVSLRALTALVLLARLVCVRVCARADGVVDTARE
jgi:hypothetical protein